MEEKSFLGKINTALLFILFVLIFILLLFIGQIGKTPTKDKTNKNEVIGNNIINGTTDGNSSTNNSTQNGTNDNGNQTSDGNNQDGNGGAGNGNNGQGNNPGDNGNYNGEGGNGSHNSENPEDSEDSEDPNKEPNPNPEEDPDYVNIIISENGKTKWDQLEKLNIFENSYFNSNKIAPGVKGKYNFQVKNSSKKKISYNIKFFEYNPKDINMKYKIKKGNQYVVGSETEWETIRGVRTPSLELLDREIDRYTIYWYWEDSENDTMVGTSGDATYNLRIDVTSTVYGE